MRRALLTIGAAIVLLIVVACQQSSSGSSGTPVAQTQTQASGPAPSGAQATSPSAAGIQTIDTAYTTLINNSVDPVTSASLATAGLNGLREAVYAAGVLAPVLPTPATGQDSQQNVALLNRTYATIANSYDTKLNRPELTDAAIAAMANSLQDCHTVYFPPTQLQDQIAAIQGTTQFGGIGASLRKPKPGDPMIIWRVFDGSPAAKAGLQSGDQILAIDGKSVDDETAQQAVTDIRGPIGQAVTLRVQAARTGEQKDLKIIRAQIQPPDVESKMLAGGYGYVQLYAFSENVDQPLKQALDNFDRNHAKAWIIDLRNNGGGALDADSKALSMFIPPKDAANKSNLLFYTWDRAGQRTDYTPNGGVRSRIPPIVILVNEGTASGAEIFAAVMREYGLAQIVGTTTAGCVGTGQLYPLPNGGGLQVTVGRLYTGLGNKMLNGLGVMPDVSVDTTSADLVAGRDPQLDRAVQLVQ